ncbi:MAG: DUF4296 domain-containing protein [Flavobacteriales bacterium]|nr:DUF4296 domain-containing protein [Flavobacteriales bacterium]
MEKDSLLIANKILIWAILFLSLSCNNQDNNIVECKLEQNKLKAVLKDVYLFETAFKNSALVSPYDSLSLDESYAFIYHKHQVEKADIESSTECYISKKQFKPLLEELEADIKKEESNFWPNDSTITIKQ